jgi:hypothetical protein
MKKILTLSLLLPILFSVACSKVPSVLQCDLEDGLEGTIAYAIEQIGNCSGTAAVRASVNVWVDSAGACAVPAKGRLKDSGSICGAIVTALGNAAGVEATQLLNAKFPTWTCNPAATVGALATLASTACSAVFPVAALTKAK